jgi:hypothetical protein
VDERSRNRPRDPAAVSRAVGRRVRRRFGLSPRRPAGWEVGPPDFVGVGAQRSGTTWWYRLICGHPGVESGLGKERHYFDRFNQRALWEDEIQAYHRLFPRPPGAVTGEWTPRYMHDFWVPAALAEAAPAAKILVMLRDPWVRFRSGLRHESQVLRKQLSRDRAGYLKATVVDDALSRSLYAKQLRRVFDHFDRSQVLVLQYERCCQDPVGELRRTFEFLELAPESIPASINVVRASSAGAGADDPLWPAARETIARDAAELGTVAPELDLDLWPSLTSPPLEAVLETA